MLELFDPDNPAAEPFGLEPVLKINPAKFTASTGSWETPQERYAMSSDTRGELSYQAVMPEGNIYRLRVAFDQFFPEAREVKLNAYWDETFIGGITLDMGAEERGTDGHTRHGLRRGSIPCDSSGTAIAAKWFSASSILNCSGSTVPILTGTEKPTGWMLISPGAKRCTNSAEAGFLRQISAGTADIPGLFGSMEIPNRSWHRMAAGLQIFRLIRKTRFRWRSPFRTAAGPFRISSYGVRQI